MFEQLQSRRKFLALSAAAGGGFFAAGCDLLSTDPEGEGSDEESGSKGAEAPMLAEKVKNGELPPVEDRLPKNPLVIEPAEQIGRYGGTWQSVEASTDPSWFWMTIVHDHLVKWDPTWSELLPNVAESYEVIDGGREYVFTLREGMKWSDGEPFTADDLVFWYEAIFNNEKLTPVKSSQLSTAGGPVVVEKGDDVTVSFRFPDPNGVFLHYVAQHGPPFWLLPRHYLEQFHPDYSTDLDAVLEEENQRDWVELFSQKMDPLFNPELPVVFGWVATSAQGESERQEWVRNPYYFKVDPDGSQLPYLDSVVYRFFNDQEPLLLEAANGNVDLYFRAEVTIPKNKPILASSRDAGGFRLVDVKNENHNTMGVCLNLTHADPVKREMFQKRDFRIGLSHAINRQEIIDIVYLRQGEPWQTAPRPELPFYESEDMAKQYTEFDLDLANEYLDKAGYSERNADGMRLDPNGEPIAISVMVQTRYPVMVDNLELIKATWAEVGIELRIENLAPELYGTRMDANQYDCALDTGELGYLGMVSDPRWFFPTGGSSYAPLWSNWYEGGEPQEEPPPAMVEQIDIYRTEVQPSADLEAQFEGMKKIIDIAKDEFWTIGISLPIGEYAILSDRLRNVPNDMWMAFKAPYPAVTNPSQYFIEE